MQNTFIQYLQIIYIKFEKEHYMDTYFLCVTQPFNAGDLLINRMLVEELSQYGKVYVDCYNCPKDFRSILIGSSENIIDVYKEYGFTLKKGAIIQFAKLISKNKIGIYTQSPGPLNKIKNIPQRLSFAAIRKTLSFLHIPFVRIGNCCSAAIVTNTNIIEDHNVHYYVRSKNAVAFLNHFNSNISHYIPDLAFLYAKYKQPLDKKKIAIFSFREIAMNIDGFVEWVKACINTLRGKGYTLIFYYQVKTDVTFMETLYDLVGDDSIEFRREILWYDNFDFYADKSIVISNRLHCLLMGAIQGAIPYAYVENNKLVRKIQDVFESIFENNMFHYLANTMPESELATLVDNISMHQSYIANVVNTNYTLCKSTIQNIMIRKI